MSSQYSLNRARQRGHAPFGVAVIGAGPVGLAAAIGLARSGLDVVVFDQRPRPSCDSRGRPQLLVARRGDLANLHQLGVDLGDARVVAPLTSIVEADLAGVHCAEKTLEPINVVPRPVTDLWQLAGQTPVALVPIVRLQSALVEKAEALGVVFRWNTRVTRVRRHARYSSVELDGNVPVLARLVIIATGGSRSVASKVGAFSLATQRSERLLIGGVFAQAGEIGRWLRAELPVAGVGRLVRCTILQTPTECDGGTALIVEVPAHSSAHLLRRGFARAAARHGLQPPFLVEPQVFATSVASVRQRFVAGNNRAPLVVAGDAAQVGHVFAGMTAFVNMALAMRLAGLVGESRVRNAVAEGRVNSGALLRALEAYEKHSRVGARVLGVAANRHYVHHEPGSWALAGVAAAS